MTDEEFRDLLAEYIAGELDEQRAAAFRAELEANEQRRKLAEELQAAAAALEVNLVSEEQAEQRTAGLKLETAAIRGPDAVSETARPVVLRYARIRAVLRYAAVVVVAFSAGFLARGWSSADQQVAARTEAPAAPINERYIDKFVEATQSFPESSSFARSLLALARR